MTGLSMTERFNSLESREVTAHSEGWVCSHAPGAVLRKRDLAEQCLALTIAEVWTISLSQYTLAKGDRLLEYICRAKVVNSLPYTEQERLYIDKVMCNKFGKYYKLETLMSREINLNDQQRAHLLQLYRSKLQELGDDVFFDKFDGIRRECYESMGIEINLTDNKEKKNQSIPYSSRLAGLLACSCADLHEGQHPFFGSLISPEELTTQISKAIQEVLTHKEKSKPQSIPFYVVDPVHSAASTLGRQGGKVKSESKSLSSRSNGKKGGRPKANQQLNMNDI